MFQPGKLMVIYQIYPSEVEDIAARIQALSSALICPRKIEKWKLLFKGVKSLFSTNKEIILRENREKSR